MFCEGMDKDRNYFVLEYFRNSDMTAGTGSYIFIDKTGKWKTLLVQSVNMLLIMLKMLFLQQKYVENQINVFLSFWKYFFFS